MRMVIAQAVGEYGGATIGAALKSSVARVAYLIEDSFDEHSYLWIGGALVVLWLFFRRKR